MNDRSLKFVASLSTLGCSMSIWLTGCSTLDAQKNHVASDQRRLAATASCCNSPKQFPLVDLASNAPLALELAEDSPVYDFPDGKSHFTAARLPTDGPGRTLRVKSLRAGAGTTLCPSLTFLDTQHNVLGTNHLTPRWQAPGMFASGFLYADQVIPSNAAYVVIHANSYSAFSSLSLTSRTYNLGIGAVQLLFPGGPTETRAVHCGFTGSVEVGYAPEAK